MNATPPGVKRDGPRASLGFQFRPLPIEHFADRRISSTAKLLHAVLLDSARRRGACKLCNRTLADLIGRSVATVKRLLSELESAGLVAREMIAGGRVRLGIVPSAGVAHSRDVDARTVAHDQSTGGASVALGVAHSLATIQSAQREIQSGGSIPLGVNPDEVPDPATAAAFLRAMIAKGRQQTPTPQPVPTGGCTVPPSSTPPVFVKCETPAAKGTHQMCPPAAKVVTTLHTPAPPAGPRLDDPRREVRVMIGNLAGMLTTGLQRPRRMPQAQLARQLAEVRRRHGAGKAPPRA